jgi:hypothetical protein
VLEKLLVSFEVALAQARGIEPAVIDEIDDPSSCQRFIRQRQVVILRILLEDGSGPDFIVVILVNQHNRLVLRLKNMGDVEN